MAELTAKQRKQIKAVIAEAQGADAPAPTPAAALAPGGGATGLRDFCKNWPGLKRLLEFIRELPGVSDRVKAAIDQIIRIGDAVHRVICPIFA